MFRFLTLPLSLLLAVSLLACGDTPDFETATVNAGGGLRMRAEPNTSANRITTIPDGASVQILATSGEEIELAGKRGKWTEVTFEKQTGWVFGGFLKSGNADSQNDNPPADSKGAKIPDKFRGKYFENPQCFNGFEAELTLYETEIWCTDGETGDFSSYCIVGKIESEDNGIAIECTGADAPQNSPGSAFENKITRTLKLSMAGDELVRFDSTPCNASQPDEGPKEFVRGPVPSDRYCQEEQLDNYP